jgi:hypothetical protein
MIIETLAPLVFAAALLRPRTEIPLIAPPPLVQPENMALRIRRVSEVPPVPAIHACTDALEPMMPPLTSPRDEVMAKLDSYVALQDGWDGEHSLAPTAHAINSAKAFLSTLPFGVPFPSPMVAPTGAAELFWDLPTGYVDVSFAANGEVSVFAERQQRPDIYAENLKPDFKSFPQQDQLLEILAPRQLRYAA